MICKKCGGEFEGPANVNNPDFGFDECLPCRRPDLFKDDELGLSESQV